MRILSKKYRKHHFWLGSLVVFFVLFALLRQSRAAMNFLAFRVVLPVMQGVGQPSRVPELGHSKRGTCTEGSLVPSPWEVRRVPHEAGVCCQSINSVR